MIRARERGIPIISIEPRYTPTAETVASQWIPIRPTTDVAMMIAMANVWFREDLCDKEFIKKWVEPEGLRQWKDYVLGVSDGIERTAVGRKDLRRAGGDNYRICPAICSQQTGQFEYLVFYGAAILGGEWHQGGNLPAGADREYNVARRHRFCGNSLRIRTT